MAGYNRMFGMELCLCWPFLSFMSNIHGKWITIGLAASINTTSTCNGSNDDSYIQIFYDGRVILSRNNGRYGGMRDEVISPLITIDYLRSKGYEFKYEIPKKLELPSKSEDKQFQLYVPLPRFNVQLILLKVPEASLVSYRSKF